MGDKRIKFFNFLNTGETEWINEQTYHRRKILNHWNKAHGYGVIEGLRPHQNAPASLDVIVPAGYAVDVNGQELVVETDHSISLGPFVPAIGTQLVYVVAEYRAVETDPVYVDELNETKNTMIEDTVVIQATTTPTSTQIELCRVNLTAGATAITDAANPFAPQDNEIDLTHMNRVPVLYQGGPSSNRPVAPVLYEQYFATDLANGNGLLIIWNGSAWVDATGTVQF